MKGSPPITPPTPLARQYVRLVVGFSAGMALGLAPFLGTFPIPGFRALLTLYPNESRLDLVTMGAFLMAVVAVVVQFYAGERLSADNLRRWFRRTTLVIGVALIALTVLVNEWVVRIGTAESTTSFVIAGERLPYDGSPGDEVIGCPCPTKMPDRICLLRLGAGDEGIPLCWDDKPRRRVNLALFASYFLLTGGFGTMIGLLILQRAAQQQEQRDRGRRPSSKVDSRGEHSGAIQVNGEAATAGTARPTAKKRKRPPRQRKPGVPPVDGNRPD